MERNDLKKFIVSLVGPLRGSYLRVDACNDMCVRRWANDTLGDIWCDVYDAEELDPRIEVVVGHLEVIWNYKEDVKNV
jgi:hypothetical protein